MISVFTFCRTRLWCKFGLPAEYPRLIWIHSWSETAFMTVIWIILQNTASNEVTSTLIYIFVSTRIKGPHFLPTRTPSPLLYLITQSRKKVSRTLHPASSLRFIPRLANFRFSILLLVGHNFTDLGHNFYLLVISIVNLQKIVCLYKKIYEVVNVTAHNVTLVGEKGCVESWTTSKFTFSYYFIQVLYSFTMHSRNNLCFFSDVVISRTLFLFNYVMRFSLKKVYQ